MSKKIYYSDIIISQVVGTIPAETREWVKNKVVMIEKNVEVKEAFQIVWLLRKVLPPKYYVSTLGPGQYEEGSTFNSLKQHA